MGCNEATAMLRCKCTLLLVFCVCFLSAQPSSSCIYFTVVTRDTLNNVKEGLSDQNVKWFQKTSAKKYPGTCYAEPGPTVPIVFYITVTADVYHGTRIVESTSTHSNPVSGTVTEQGGSTSQVTGTVESTTTSSTAVPYSFEYGIYTLSVERRRSDGQFDVLHRFRQKGLYSTLYGIPLGGRGHHPVHTVIEDAAKWLSSGGLTDQRQSVVGYGEPKLNGGGSSDEAEQPTVSGRENPIERQAVPTSSTDASRKISLPVVAPRATKPMQPSPVTTAPVITARFQSIPANAEVDVDGVYWGTTPTAEITGLRPGTHTIVVKKIGYKLWERTVDLGLGDDLTVNAALEVDTTKPRISGLN